MTRKTARSGFTLMEVLLATAIAAVGIIATSTAMSAAATSKAELASQPALALTLAREIGALAETLPRTPSGETGATDGADVVALDCLDGAVFEPPILADGSADASLSDWKQSVAIEVFALDDLETPTGEDVSTALSSNAPRLYRLVVTVRYDGQVEATVCFWCRP